MQIDAGVNASQLTQAMSSVNQVKSNSLDSNSNAQRSSASSVERLDFNNMTREEMRTWINNEIKSGQMDLDDSSALMAMTMKMPVAGGGEVAVESDTERFDFVQKAFEGMDAALSRHDQAGYERLSMAVQTMQQAQGGISSLDIHV
ncbi:hypothetical protein [Gynuella sunshinyii]|uniref:Uncharacterized protein n=1 Tax=Gynuella sunshinyii YC6258 TaxID=1445510 RepID=A0A0C5V821_9GAMM|nr:hypothetical protein [Gynuella sunshinyii]AJQ95560.1 hypothetical Protein YC6258_03524 [Gynuella sunshinyii YC6258]